MFKGVCKILFVKNGLFGFESTGSAKINPKFRCITSFFVRYITILFYVLHNRLQKKKNKCMTTLIIYGTIGKCDCPRFIIITLIIQLIISTPFYNIKPIYVDLSGRVVLQINYFQKNNSFTLMCSVSIYL